MLSTRSEIQTRIVIAELPEERGGAMSRDDDSLRLRRWLVSFASGREWYPVGEFVALDGQAAIERAVDVFGAAAGYRAEEIPWDAAPLVRPNAPARQEPR